VVDAHSICSCRIDEREAKKTAFQLIELKTFALLPGHGGGLGPTEEFELHPDSRSPEEAGAQRRRFVPAPAPPPPRDIITPRMKPKSYQFPLLTTS
jgi:hypothetical protein